MAADTGTVPGLTKSQAARRERVIRAALELAAEGGYDAVQMRDVAARGEVALGTIYRYFPSKDALLLAVMVQWLGDLEQRVTRHPPAGATTVDRVMDVLTRAVRSMEREPRLTRAVISAMTAGDPAGVAAIGEVTRHDGPHHGRRVPRRRRPRPGGERGQGAGARVVVGHHLVGQRHGRRRLGGWRSCARPPA